MAAGEPKDAGPWSFAGRGARARVGVVVTHGFTGNPRATRPLGERLADEGYTVEVPLLPGHGTTHRDLGRTRYHDWYGHLDRTVDDLVGRCERVVLVGHSLGATLSLDVATRRSDDVHGVVSIAGQILDRTELLARLAPLLQHVVPYVPRDAAGLPTDDIARPGATEGAYAFVPARAAQSIMRELPRLRAALPSLTRPLLVAYPPDDHTVPAENSRRLIELAGSTDVRELVCKRSYHVVPLDYDAEMLAEAVVAFVAEVADA